MIGERSPEIGVHCFGLLPHVASLNPDSMPTLSTVDPDIFGVSKSSQLIPRCIGFTCLNTSCLVKNLQQTQSFVTIPKIYFVT